jgi:hypothetical protein
MTGRRACDPARLTGRTRQSTIQRHPAFRDHKRAPDDNPFVERLVKACALLGQDALSQPNARIPQPRNAFAGVTWIYVYGADNYVSDSSLQDCICASGSAPDRGTGFQSNVQRCASRHGGGEIAETFDLSVVVASSPVVAFCYYSIVNDQNSSNSGIWTCTSMCLFRFF